MPRVEWRSRYRNVLIAIGTTLLLGCGGTSAPDTVSTPSETASTPETSSAPETPPPVEPTPNAEAAASPSEPPRPSSEPAAVLPAPLPPEQLWSRLQQAEDTLYVVMMRHAIAPGTGDPANFQLDDCSTQRNLSDTGRSQAEQIGQAFRDRGVSVRQVRSSQWCRCLETAELLNLAPVEPLPALNSFFRDRSTADAQTIAVKEYLQQAAETPGVIVLVTHQVNITALTDYFPRSGEAVVLEASETELTQLGALMPAP